jgi:hypothetical protein
MVDSTPSRRLGARFESGKRRSQGLGKGHRYMSELFEIDPHTGIRTDTDWDEATQRMTLIRSADVEPVLDYAKHVSNEVGKNSTDIKKGWWLYAKLPPIIILQMRAKGINVFDPNDSGRVVAEINANYPMLKTTTGVDRGDMQKLYV